MSRSTVFLLVFVMIFILSLLGGCTQPTQSPISGPMSKEVELTEKGLACGSTVGLDVGDTLVLVLDGEPSTTFTWEVTPSIRKVIESTGEPLYLPGSDQGMAGGTYTFRFHTVSTGVVTIKMIYHQPKEQDLTKHKTCEVTVNVT